MDVGYTRKIGDQEMVVYKRNITIGVGCICQPMEIHRVQQVEQVETPGQI